MQEYIQTIFADYAINRVNDVKTQQQSVILVAILIARPLITKLILWMLRCAVINVLILIAWFANKSLPISASTAKTIFLPLHSY